ncbi:MAG: response regulator transcription factor [Peptococcaceae bacterium]|nr:response regulator transcription factor [Peptococcaceae bacterium]MDH7524924.1 response regulator transcription factor [Peptococcaceae bacterium]
MEKKTVLVVDDEFKIRVLLRDFLEKEGFNVVEAENGKQALHIFQSLNKVDLVLLDVMLPCYDGWTVCREIRKRSNVPVIMLTARSEEFDEVHGFEIGADDYVVKPVKLTALIARVHALFRRIEKHRDEKKRLVSGGLEIDDASHVVTVDKKEIILSPKEYALLYILVEKKGRVVSREELMNQVWGYEYYGGLRTVDTHINRLRMKLGKKGNAITTIRGFGYRFEG